VIQQIKDKFENFQYGNSQMGLVFVLFFIILSVLPISIYGMIFFIPISADEVNYYSKFGAWFTALGAIFTVINTVVVIYLMLWLHHKESNANLFPRFQELQDKLTKISSIFDQEVDSFLDKQSNAAMELEMIHFDAPNSSPQYERAYSAEVNNIDEIIK